MRHGLGAAIIGAALLLTPDVASGPEYDHVALETCDAEHHPYLFPPDQVRERAQFYAPIVDATEDHYDLPEGSLGGLIHSESTWDPLAVSPTGAAGLGQLTARTARSLDLRVPDDLTERFNHWTYEHRTMSYVEANRDCPRSLVQDDERFEPKRSIRAAASYFDSLYEQGTLESAIRDYKGFGPSHQKAALFQDRFEQGRSWYESVVEEDSMYRAEYAKHRLWLADQHGDGQSPS